MQQGSNGRIFPAMLAAVVAMVVMIVAVDQIFWQPVVVWSQRFRMEDLAQSEVRESWMLNLLHRSRVFQRLTALFKRRDRLREAVPLQVPAAVEVSANSGPAPQNARSSAKAQTDAPR